MPPSGAAVFLLESQLAHVGSLTVHRHRDDELASSFCGRGQSGIHLVKARKTELWIPYLHTLYLSEGGHDMRLRPGDA
jgi:hypothetical protein